MQAIPTDVYRAKNKIKRGAWYMKKKRNSVIIVKTRPTIEMDCVLVDDSEWNKVKGK